MDAQIQEVFDFWNSFAEEELRAENARLKSDKGVWKQHRQCDYDMQEAIRYHLKHYSVEDLKDAIQNYATILQDKQYKWTYAWTLVAFFTRREADDRKVYKWRRFSSNTGFRAEDYLTDEARRNRRQRTEERQAALPDVAPDKQFVPYSKRSTEELTRIAANPANHFEDKLVRAELRKRQQAKECVNG